MSPFALDHARLKSALHALGPLEPNGAAILRSGRIGVNLPITTSIGLKDIELLLLVGGFDFCGQQSLKPTLRRDG